MLAFPGARGFGARVTGGRGGSVIKVTNLDDSGPGSLQWALDQSGPRIIVFEVSGIIEADMITITEGDVTVAGQTAPGAGITIHGRLYAENAWNIILRHLRIRPEYDGSEGEQFDALRLSYMSGAMVDHISVSGGVDETVDMYTAIDATVQWSTIECAGTEGHPEGRHNYGLINGPDGIRVSILYNLFANNSRRNPAIANGPSEVSYNVNYNTEAGFVHNNPASGPFNFVGNTFRPGPSDELMPFYFDDENGSPDPDLSYALVDNQIDGEGSACTGAALDNPWEQCDIYHESPESTLTHELHDFSGASDGYYAPEMNTAEAAFIDVLAYAGAFPRDVIAERTISELNAGTGEWGARVPSDLMQGLTAGSPPADEDDDGMADNWEAQHGLDPNDGSDHSTVMPSGYTAIEEYVNGLAYALAPT